MGERVGRYVARLEYNYAVLEIHPGVLSAYWLT